MTGIYENSSQRINSNQILESINYLKEVFNIMKEKFIEIKTKHEEAKYKKEVKKILSLMDEIEELIEKNPLFSDIELFDFTNMKEMTTYILKDSNLFEEHSNFLLEFLKDYNQIVVLKFEAKKEYEEEYKKFKYIFNRKREFFYSHIYEHLGIYDDMIDEYVNILGGGLD